jgi:hypothetical protein
MDIEDVFNNIIWEEKEIKCRTCGEKMLFIKPDKKLFLVDPYYVCSSKTCKNKDLTYELIVDE